MNNDDVAITSVLDTTKSSFLDTLKDKLSSRKFVISLIGVITGICGIIGCNDNVIAVVAFIVLEILSIVSYLICEGKIDAAAVVKGVDVTDEIMEVLDSLKSDDEVKIPEKSSGKEYLDSLSTTEDNQASTATAATVVTLDVNGLELCDSETNESITK